MPALHFIGFRGEEYWSAVRVWGKPDYVWPKATWSVLGEISGEDTIIFAKHAYDVPKKWRKLLAHHLT